MKAKTRKCKQCGIKKNVDALRFVGTSALCGDACMKEFILSKKKNISLKPKKKKAKKKAPTIAQLTEKAATLLQKLRRLEEADENGFCTCVTCGAVKKWNDGMQGGHYISRGKTATKLVKMNIWPQCAACNCFGMKYESLSNQYTLFMIDNFSRKAVDKLLKLSRTTVKLKRENINARIERYIRQINKLEGKKCKN